mgnify:CR=1 FL=1
MAKTCTWTFAYKEHGRWKYRTECGLIMELQRYGYYCPHCGGKIKKKPEDGYVTEII